MAQAASGTGVPTLRDPNRDAERNANVAKAVMAGLGYFGAGQVVESLVYILELEHSVDMNSIADNIEGLKKALTKMFGSAAHVVETKIAEALGKQLGVDSEGKSIEDLIRILDARDGNLH